jgi:hypothetical protein
MFGLPDLWKTVVAFLGSYIVLVLGIWGFIEAYTYFEGDHLKQIVGPYWWALYGVPIPVALCVALWRDKPERPRRFVRWVMGLWHYIVIAVLLILLEVALFVLYTNWLIVTFSVLHFALVALAAWLLSFRRQKRRDVTGEPRDIQQVVHSSVGLPLGAAPSRIFHRATPCVLPVCFRNPRRSEYVYVVVDTRVDNPDEDNRAHIATRPGLALGDTASVTVRRARWYQLTSDKPLEWVRFGDGPTVRDFMVVEAEIHPVRKWNRHDPQVVPGDQEMAYGLAITEQIEPSTWFVSIDDREYSFRNNLGCHLVEFVLPQGQQHRLSFGHKDGPRGIASAFFAF